MKKRIIHVLKVSKLQIMEKNLSMFVMIWATAVFNFWSAEQRVEYQYRNLVIVTLIITMAKPLVGIFFVIHAEDKVTARILGLALVELVGYTGFFIFGSQ